MRELLLGLDVGTTATKAILFDLDGQLVASASYSYGLITPEPDWVEQDPNEFWLGVVTTCRQLVSALKSGDRILALCQSSQAGTTIPVNADGEHLYNAFSWLDARGKDHESLVRQELGDDYIRTTTGWALRDVFSLQHIGWLRLNRPDIFASVRYFMFVNDFIGFHLTGERCMNPSDAGVTQVFNIAENDWDQKILNLLAVRKEQLSPVVSIRSTGRENLMRLPLNRRGCQKGCQFSTAPMTSTALQSGWGSPHPVRFPCPAAPPGCCWQFPPAAKPGCRPLCLSGGMPFPGSGAASRAWAGWAHPLSGCSTRCGAVRRWAESAADFILR